MNKLLLLRCKLSRLAWLLCIRAILLVHYTTRAPSLNTGSSSTAEILRQLVTVIQLADDTAPPGNYGRLQLLMLDYLFVRGLNNPRGGHETALIRWAGSGGLYLK